MRGPFLIGTTLLIILLIAGAILLAPIYWWALGIFAPFALIIYYDSFQNKHAILRNFPLLGRSRYAAEWLRPKLYQYFIESDTDGKPISRIYRSIAYQRAKKANATTPFGTQVDVYSEGYEWMNHSIAPLDHHEIFHY